MTFTKKNNHIAILSMVNCIIHSLLTVRNHHILTVCLCQTNLNIFYNIHYVFRSRIITCHNCKFRQISNGLSHLVTAQFASIAATSENSNNPVRIVTTQSL